MNDLISRQFLLECVNEGWIKFETEKDNNIFTHLVRDIAPPADPDFNTISYQNCAFALRKMQIDNILTSREYIEISDRLSAIQKGMKKHER